MNNLFVNDGYFPQPRKITVSVLWMVSIILSRYWLLLSTFRQSLFSAGSSKSQASRASAGGKTSDANDATSTAKKTRLHLNMAMCEYFNSEKNVE